MLCWCRFSFDSFFRSFLYVSKLLIWFFWMALVGGAPFEIMNYPKNKQIKSVFFFNKKLSCNCNFGSQKKNKKIINFFDVRKEWTRKINKNAFNYDVFVLAVPTIAVARGTDLFSHNLYGQHYPLIVIRNPIRFLSCKCVAPLNVRSIF